METPDPAPLTADPLRQAIASLRGYASQIVRTTRAWVDLEDGEVLYVEGAEDFDTVSRAGTAEAVQVKDVAGNITLATREVSEALVHFWTHQRRNPDRKVSFRYLTTAGRGRERDSRFGDRPGLDYWDNCSSPGTDLQPLREFIADRLGTLTKRRRNRESAAQTTAREEWNEAIADLVDFVRESTDEEFRDKLVNRVTWETASPETAEVISELEAALVEQGERLLGVKPSVAKKAVSQLLLHVWEVACDDGERALRRAEFLEKFEETVDDVHIPREELNRLRAAASRSDAAALPAEPSSASWYARVLRNRYSEAREAAKTGHLKKANEQLQHLLESVRKEASAEDPERRQFEQGLLLSRAQNSLRFGNRTDAESLYSEAAALAPFEDKNRHLAGWVLTNLGRPEKAIEQLDPSDGTPQWQATLAIALIGAGLLDRYEELFGDEHGLDSADVLLALVRHYIGTEEAVRADHLARRLANEDNETPEARFRAVEAAFAVFQLAVSSPTAPPVDSGEWILILRRLFSNSREVMNGGVPLIRLLVLRRRIEFYEILSEGDEVAKDFRAFVKAAPAMAAEIAAFGVTTPRDVDLMAAREGARDPVHAAIIDAVHFDTDRDVTLRRLTDLEPSAKGAEREMLLVLCLELAAAQGENPDVLTEQAGNISDPITQRIVEAGICRQAHQRERAREVIEAALERYPESLRVLRFAYGMSRSLGPWEEEVELAKRIYARLPAPEFRLQLAESRMRAGDVDGALRESAAVEEEGTRAAKAAYTSAQFALQGRRMSEHAAAALRFYEADGSDRGRLYAGMAALRARQYGNAEKLYRGLLESEDRETRLSAFGGLAHSIDAQGGGLPSAREQSVAVLLQGYDRLDAPPEIAGALYYRALGTRFGKDVHERIGRDFGSLANLPGMIAIPAEEGLEMIRREQEGIRLRTELLRAGVLPFETTVTLGHRRASYLWFAHRRDHVLMMVEPPRFPPRPDDTFLQRQRPPLLVDRTALLMLIETGLLARVLQSDLKLLMETDTYDWLEEEEHSLQAEGRPVEREGLRELFKAIDDQPQIALMRATQVDEALLETFRQSLSWGDSYELACARRDDLQVIDDFIDLNDVPEEERFRFWRSGDLLRALVASEQVSLANAASAQEHRPSSFGRSRGGSLPLEQSFLITKGVLEAWHDSHLLERLAESVGRLVVSPLAERHAREHLGERDADADALAAVSTIRELVVEAVDVGRVRLVGRKEDKMAGREQEYEGESDASGTLLGGIAAPLRRTYEQAAAAGASIWSDDPAVRLYLDPLGPMISGSAELSHLAMSLRESYSNVDVVGTSDVMVWLEDAGLLTEEQRISILADLSAHGRALTGESTVYAMAADSRALGSTEASVLDLAEAMPPALPPDVVRRFSPRVSTALAAAIAEVWFRDDVSEDERTKSVQALIQALRPWVAPSLPHARFMAETMWAALVVELVQRLGTETEKLLRLILSEAATDQAEFRHFLPAVWKAIDVLHGITSGESAEAKRLGGMLVAMIAVASDGVQVRGRPILPDHMIRLAADLFGIGGVLTHAATFQAISDGEEHQFTVEDATLEEDAADAVNRLAENQSEAAPANAVPVEVEVISDDGTVRAPFRGSVDVARIFRRLTLPARRFAVTALALYYRERNCPEIADSLDGLTDEIASEEAATAEAAHRTVLTTILASPRLWAEHDAHRAFSLLRDAPLEDLERMAGNPEPWVAGETLAERTVRIRGGFTTADEFLEDARALWGPFEVAVDQCVELGLSPKAAEGANRDSMLSLIRTAVTADFPYDRVLPLGMALALAQSRADLADSEVVDLNLEFPGTAGRLVFRGSAQQLLSQLLSKWLTNEFDRPVLENSAVGADVSDDAVSLDRIAAVHALLDRLAVDVERFVYRAVLSERHDEEATAKVADAEVRDSIGDLLLLGHRLAGVMLPPFLGQAHRRNVAVVIQDLEEAHSQFPLSQQRIPLREVFVPEVLGVGGGGVNPSLVLLLAFLQRLAGSRVEGNSAADDPPPWWTEDVQAALRALAQRERPPQLRNLETIAHSEGASDRFGSLLTIGVEGHARRLLAILDPSTPGD